MSETVIQPLNPAAAEAFQFMPQDPNMLALAENLRLTNDLDPVRLAKVPAYDRAAVSHTQGIALGNPEAYAAANLVLEEVDGPSTSGQLAPEVVSVYRRALDGSAVPRPVELPTPPPLTSQERQAYHEFMDGFQARFGEAIGERPDSVPASLLAPTAAGNQPVQNQSAAMWDTKRASWETDRDDAVESLRSALEKDPSLANPILAKLVEYDALATRLQTQAETGRDTADTTLATANRYRHDIDEADDRILAAEAAVRNLKDATGRGAKKDRKTAEEKLAAAQQYKSSLQVAQHYAQTQGHDQARSAGRQGAQHGNADRSATGLAEFVGILRSEGLIDTDRGLPNFEHVQLAHRRQLANATAASIAELQYVTSATPEDRAMLMHGVANRKADLRRQIADINVRMSAPGVRDGGRTQQQLNQLRGDVISAYNAVQYVDLENRVRMSTNAANEGDPNFRNHFEVAIRPDGGITEHRPSYNVTYYPDRSMEFSPNDSQPLPQNLRTGRQNPDGSAWVEPHPESLVLQGEPRNPHLKAVARGVAERVHLREPQNELPLQDATNRWSHAYAQWFHNQGNPQAKTLLARQSARLQERYANEYRAATQRIHEAQTAGEPISPHDIALQEASNVMTNRTLYFGLLAQVGLRNPGQEHTPVVVNVRPDGGILTRAALLGQTMPGRWIVYSDGSLVQLHEATGAGGTTRVWNGRRYAPSGAEYIA